MGSSAVPNFSNNDFKMNLYFNEICSVPVTKCCKYTWYWTSKTSLNGKNSFNWKYSSRIIKHSWLYQCLIATRTKIERFSRARLSVRNRFIQTDFEIWRHVRVNMFKFEAHLWCLIPCQTIGRFFKEGNRIQTISHLPVSWISIPYTVNEIFSSTSS